jgi:hypothetical protein
MNFMVLRLSCPLAFENAPEFDGPTNPTSLFDTLGIAATAGPSHEDQTIIRHLFPTRIVAVITQPITSDTVLDVLECEAMCLSIAVKLSWGIQPMLFLQTMTLWCTVMWHIGLTADVRSVLCHLDAFGRALRNHSHTKMVEAQRAALRYAAEGRKTFGDYLKEVRFLPEEPVVRFESGVGGTNGTNIPTGCKNGLENHLAQGLPLRRSSRLRPWATS